ncbi:MAG TPA: carboxypeptidase-like regulatory domain-containing protein, partial [Blastocatellia bacterium]
MALGSLTNLVPTVSAAQGSNTGRLVGSVTNQQGEVVAGATIVVTDNATGKEQTVISSSEGTFALSQLEVGTYTVKVTAQNFKSFTATDVKIDLGREYSLTVPLEIGGVTENVTVTAGADLLNATSGELSNSISMKEVRELPLNGRNPIGLITTQAGTSSNGAQTTAVNGQRSSFTNITRDGINIQDNFIRANAVDFVPDRPNVDDVGEITITTQNAGAELGYGSSQIQLVTPRGSNAFHGAGYIYNRNSELAANTFFNNAAGNFTDGRERVPRPFLNRNQYGGRIGGPVLKEKLFFFFSYEGFRQRSSTSATRTTLLPSARQGIFTFVNNAGVRQTANILALTGVSIDPVVKSRILDLLPTSGNTTAAGDQLNTTGFQVSRLQNQDRDAYTTRIDYEITQNNSISGVYSYRKEFLLRPDVDAIGPSGFTSSPTSNQFAHTRFLALSYRMNPTSRLTNEVRGGFQTSDPAFGRNIDLPEFFIGVPLISNPEVNFEPQGRNTKIYNFQDNAVFAKGQ